VFENRVLKRISAPETDEVTRGWRKLHHDELRHLYSKPNIIRMIKPTRIRWAGHMGAMGNACRILVGEPDGKGPLGRPRRRWGYNIKMDLRKVGLEGVEWIYLVQNRDQWRILVNIMNLRVP
jgi:hypothetical protein